MNVAFLGPPNSGKGTYAKRVSKALGVPYVGSGDLFRKAYEDKTALGIKAHEYFGNGKPVPDELTINLLIQELKKAKNEKGFIFDTPYNANQAKAIDDDPQTRIDAAINVVVPDEILIRRGSSRVTCGKCGWIYNTLTLKPKQDGICDKCGGKLVQREDDKPDRIKVRLQEYKKRSGPMEEYYKKENKLKEVNWSKKLVPKGEIDIPIGVMLDKILSLLKE
ncbi:nucleoside monophosphate kinase [Candidatus Micrarchaeota archaeon]|nr:nucleoside monophosphate kinase [Candidatus Micrarchaeota archaeon]